MGRRGNTATADATEERASAAAGAGVVVVLGGSTATETTSATSADAKIVLLRDSSPSSPTPLPWTRCEGAACGCCAAVMASCCCGSCFASSPCAPPTVGREVAENDAMDTAGGRGRRFGTVDTTRYTLAPSITKQLSFSSPRQTNRCPPSSVQRNVHFRAPCGAACSGDLVTRPPFRSVGFDRLAGSPGLMEM